MIPTSWLSVTLLILFASIYRQNKELNKPPARLSHSEVSFSEDVAIYEWMNVEGKWRESEDGIYLSAVEWRYVIECDCWCDTDEEKVVDGIYFNKNIYIF
jgi:hypothetical protein